MKWDSRLYSHILSSDNAKRIRCRYIALRYEKERWGGVGGYGQLPKHRPKNYRQKPPYPHTCISEQARWIRSTSLLINDNRHMCKGKMKLSLKTWWSGGILRSFLTSALDKGKWSASRPSRITAGKEPLDKHRIEDFMSPTAGLLASKRRKISWTCQESIQNSWYFQPAS